MTTSRTLNNTLIMIQQELTELLPRNTPRILRAESETIQGTTARTRFRGRFELHPNIVQDPSQSYNLEFYIPQLEQEGSFGVIERIALEISRTFMRSFPSNTFIEPIPARSNAMTTTLTNQLRMVTNPAGERTIGYGATPPPTGLEEEFIRRFPPPPLPHLPWEIDGNDRYGGIVNDLITTTAAGNPQRLTTPLTSITTNSVNPFSTLTTRSISTGSISSQQGRAPQEVLSAKHKDPSHSYSDRGVDDIIRAIFERISIETDVDLEGCDLSVTTKILFSLSNGETLTTEHIGDTINLEDLINDDSDK